ncbi:MAG TPA: HPr family phosphocarrier protein [Geminicoccus sp.]|uniref:HPr family phosphocarrier protein n=1 Tax=Geminicoccus sp. TaxID=2024832 RepID=UPI002E2EAE72|nr:HPr family phosphocarrier protein [Geminicoccus sp.]HEX2525587.1 HPr family phosphocarrier protein [Geminicoccus sp.]
MSGLAVEVLVCNQRGLHARAAAKLVRLASTFDAVVSVGKDDTSVTATSILGLMMLGAGVGSSLRLQADGREAEPALKAIAALIQRGFDE